MMQNMGEQLLRLDVQNSIDGLSHRVSISATKRVKDLLEKVKDQTGCLDLTTLAVVRGEIEARLCAEDVLSVALDQTETRLKASAEPLELPRHRSRSGRVSTADRTREPAPGDNAECCFVEVKQSFRLPVGSDEEFTLSVDRGEEVEVSDATDRGWRACRKGSAVGWVPEWAFFSQQNPQKPQIKACVKRLKAKTGQFVDGIQMELHSGAQQLYGGSGGVETTEFTLDEDEAIVAVEQVESRKCLAEHLIFQTSNGRRIEVKGYGGPGKEARKHRFVAPDKKQICGLVFRDTKLAGVCVQSQFKRGSRKHPQRLKKDVLKYVKSNR